MNELKLKDRNGTVDISDAMRLIGAALTILLPCTFFSNGNYNANYIINLTHSVKIERALKKYFLCAFLFCIFFTANNATAQQGFSFSLKTIPLYSFLINKTDINNARYSLKPTVNTNFGIGGTYNFTKNMGIGADVLYACQGQHYTINGTSGNYYQKNKYIKVPVYLSYNSDITKRVSFIGKIGPQISFLTQSSLDYNQGSKLSSNTKKKDETVSLGAMMLAGTQYKLSDDLYFTSGVRFDYDYFNADDNRHISSVNTSAKSHNMTTGVELGLKYVFSK